MNKKKYEESSRILFDYICYPDSKICEEEINNCIKILNHNKIGMWYTYKEFKTRITGSIDLKLKKKNIKSQYSFFSDWDILGSDNNIKNNDVVANLHTIKTYNFDFYYKLAFLYITITKPDLITHIIRTCLKKLLYIILSIFLVIFPLVIQSNFFNLGTILKSTVQIGQPSNWLNFWAAYLGSILSIIFAYLNTKWQLKKNKEFELNKIDAYNISKLMIIIIQRNNEYEQSKSLADKIIEVIDTKTELSIYEVLLKKSYILLSQYLDDKENSHVKEWNEFFISFDDTNPEIKKIVNKWNKIGSLLQKYSNEIDPDIQLAISSTNKRNDFKKGIYKDQIAKASNTLKNMADVCKEIYNQLQEIYRMKVDNSSTIEKYITQKIKKYIYTSIIIIFLVLLLIFPK